MKLIDKDALVAEIERRIKALHSTLNEREAAVKFELRDLLSFLDTLEVKEVDLEKEISTWYDTKASKEFEGVFYRDIEKCAEYFFELGLKTQKGE